MPSPLATHGMTRRRGRAAGVDLGVSRGKSPCTSRQLPRKVEARQGGWQPELPPMKRLNESPDDPRWSGQPCARAGVLARRAGRPATMTAHRRGSIWLRCPRSRQPWSHPACAREGGARQRCHWLGEDTGAAGAGWWEATTTSLSSLPHRSARWRCSGQMEGEGGYRTSAYMHHSEVRAVETEWRTLRRGSADYGRQVSVRSPS
jgi:hypothetical protein